MMSSDGLAKVKGGYNWSSQGEGTTGRVKGGVQLV